jgi:hypothetical protein
MALFSTLPKTTWPVKSLMALPAQLTSNILYVGLPNSVIHINELSSFHTCAKKTLAHAKSNGSSFSIIIGPF